MGTSHRHLAEKMRAISVFSKMNRLSALLLVFVLVAVALEVSPPHAWVWLLPALHFHQM